MWEIKSIRGDGKNFFVVLRISPIIAGEFGLQDFNQQVCHCHAAGFGDPHDALAEGSLDVGAQGDGDLFPAQRVAPAGLFFGDAGVRGSDGFVW